MTVLQRWAPRVAVLAFVIGGCGGGLGGIFGGEPAAGADEIAGTVERVDTRNRVIVLRPDRAVETGLREREPELVEVSYAPETRVEFRGQTYRPEDLEPGDRIVVRVDASGDRLVAQNIEVTEDVRADERVAGADRIEGVVRSVDTRAQTIELDQARTRTRTRAVTVHYDRDTRVEVQGREYSPSALEPGDEVAIEVRDERGRLIAQDITVLADARTARR